jgi:guanylate kinase
VSWSKTWNKVKKGPVIILSGPAGSGKSTVVRDLLLTENGRLRRAVTATTRAPRPNEADGIDYHFWSPEQFARERQAGMLLESAEVFGHWYGTPRSEVEPYRARGLGVILVIDVQGAAQIRQQYPDTISIFLRAPSLGEYEQRLRGRRTESEEALSRRLEGAKRELERARDYDFQVTNDDLGQAIADVRTIIQGLLGKDEECSMN